MSKIIFVIAAAFVFLGVVSAAKSYEVHPCIEKPCTREYNPVAVIDGESTCKTFPNICFLENAIHCRRIVGAIACVKGDCRHRGERIPCPVIYE